MRLFDVGVVNGTGEGAERKSGGAYATSALCLRCVWTFYASLGVGRFSYAHSAATHFGVETHCLT
jgi:hypothetical protein